MIDLEQKVADKLIIRLEGELDHHHVRAVVEHIDQSLDQNNPKTLVLDCSGITFMDSSGVGLVLGRYKICRARGIVLELIRIPPMARRIFSMSGVLALLATQQREEKQDVTSNQ